MSRTVHSKEASCAIREDRGRHSYGSSTLLVNLAFEEVNDVLDAIEV